MNFFKSHKKIFLLIFCLPILACLTIIGVHFFNPYPLKYKTEIIEASQTYNIKPEIIASIVNAESGFNALAKSSQGACGLMQIMPSTAEWVYSLQGKTNFNKQILMDPNENLSIGTYYLNYLLEKFNCLETALAAYNAGEGNVMLWLLCEDYSPDQKTIHSTPFKETNAYISKVLNGIKIYEKKLNK